MALRLVIAVGFVAAAAALPSHASAASLNAGSEGDSLTYTAKAGEANDVRITQVDSRYLVTDRGAQIQPAGPFCRGLTANSAICTSPTGVRNVTVTLNDRDDRATVAGGYEFLNIDGGTGDDTVHGSRTQAGTTLTGADGDDELVIDAGAALLPLGGSFGNTLRGDAGDDVLRGNADEEWLFGGTGADDLDGGGGPDVFDGGTEDDSLRSLDLVTEERVTCGDGADVLSAEQGDLWDADCESVTTSPLS